MDRSSLGKGCFSGKSHSFKANLTPPIGSGSSFRASSFEGQWNATSKDTKTGVVFTDVTGPKEEVTVRSVRPVEDQGEWESRALWLKVAKGIRESDFETASKEKTRIENEQRQKRRDEAAEGTTWELKHFVHQDDDPLYERLGKLFKSMPPTEDVYVYQNNGPKFEEA